MSCFYYYFFSHPLHLFFIFNLLFLLVLFLCTSSFILFIVIVRANVALDAGCKAENHSADQREPEDVQRLQNESKENAQNLVVEGDLRDRA